MAWGYETIFQYVGIFVWEFSFEFFIGFFVLRYFGIFLLDFFCYYTLVFLCGTSCDGGFYMVPLAYDNGMGPRYWEWESRHRATPLMFAQAQGYRLPSRGAKAVVSCFSKKNDGRRAKRSAHGGRSERRERWAAPEDM